MIFTSPLCPPRLSSRAAPCGAVAPARPPKNPPTLIFTSRPKSALWAGTRPHAQYNDPPDGIFRRPMPHSGEIGRGLRCSRQFACVRDALPLDERQPQRGVVARPRSRSSAGTSHSAYRSCARWPSSRARRPCRGRGTARSRARPRARLRTLKRRSCRRECERSAINVRARPPLCNTARSIKKRGSTK